MVLELGNPQLDQELQDVHLKVQAAETSLQDLRVQTQNDYLQQKATGASISGDYNKAMLQVVPVDVGQQVAPGTNLARVANPRRLKAEVRIAETQAKDIQIGQSTSTRAAASSTDWWRAPTRRCRMARSRWMWRSPATCQKGPCPT